MPDIQRRSVLRMLATLPLISSSMVTAQAFAAQAHQDNDARLVAIANEMEAVEFACNAHTAAHRGRETKDSEDDFHEIVERFTPLEDEMAETPADTMVGVLAKARALQVPTIRECCVEEMCGSLADDLVRLHAMGALA